VLTGSDRLSVADVGLSTRGQAPISIALSCSRHSLSRVRGHDVSAGGRRVNRLHMPGVDARSIIKTRHSSEEARTPNHLLVYVFIRLDEQFLSASLLFDMLNVVSKASRSHAPLLRRRAIVSPSLPTTPPPLPLLPPPPNSHRSTTLSRLARGSST